MERSSALARHDAWATSARVVSAAARPWAAVRGPAGAVVATLRRIGWTAWSSRVWVTDQGTVIDLLRTSPASLGVLVDRAIEQWLHRKWARAACAPHLDGILFIEPLRALVRRAPRPGWTPCPRARPALHCRWRSMAPSPPCRGRVRFLASLHHLRLPPWYPRAQAHCVRCHAPLSAASPW